jgi:class 3 adenylate cyclase
MFLPTPVTGWLWRSVGASSAVAAAVEAQKSLSSDRFATVGLRVRMGLHTGVAVERDGDYFGPTVNRAARIMAAGHGGQVLLSATTRRLVAGLDTVDLGDHRLQASTNQWESTSSSSTT